MLLDSRIWNKPSFRHVTTLPRSRPSVMNRVRQCRIDVFHAWYRQDGSAGELSSHRLVAFVIKKSPTLEASSFRQVNDVNLYWKKKTIILYVQDTHHALSLCCREVEYKVSVECLIRPPLCISSSLTLRRTSQHHRNVFNQANQAVQPCLRAVSVVSNLCS